jgi:UDP-GlcNAc3NAcA epimerase
MKIMTVIGARPQFIKAGSVSRCIKAKQQQGLNVEEIIVHTGQHYDFNMSDIFFDEMEIPKPQYNLGIGGTTHGAMTGQMIEKLEKVMMEVLPDWVMLYGDTNSTLAGAIAASKLNIEVAHVEAGLRSFNMKMPEEINRILTDRISSVLFCPTSKAFNQLKAEGLDRWESGAKAVLSGDVMYDGALFYRNKSIKPDFINEVRKFVLCTIHRAENTSNKNNLFNIVKALKIISKQIDIILPLHPRTKKIIENLDLDLTGITVVDPVGYLNMIWLLDKCSMVITDSGGLQKEAFFFSKYCITLREETEWSELIEYGVNRLVGSSEKSIIEAFDYAIGYNGNFDMRPYGDGNSSSVIVDYLIAKC